MAEKSTPGEHPTSPRDPKAPRQVVANDPNDMKGTMKHIGGSQSDNWNNTLATQAVRSLWLKHSDDGETDRQMSATVAGLAGIAPKDEIEGMMAAQMIAAHNAAMECYRRAMLPEQPMQARSDNLTQANKLSRTYATLVEALGRHRGKGQQKVTVEHVHVYSGGQAVVGNIDPLALGVGGRKNSGEQAHAKQQISHEPQPALPCADPIRDGLPVTGNA